MQGFKQDDYIKKNQDYEKSQEQALIEKEMEKYLSMTRIERVQEKTSSKGDDYIQPITPISTPSVNVDTSNKDLAKSQEVKTEDVAEETHYNIVYFNPELKKPEVIETTSKIKFQSIEEKVVEESLGLRNVNVAMDYVFKDLIKDTISVSPQVKEIEKQSQLIKKRPIEIEQKRINPVEISHSLTKRDEVVVEIQKQIREMEFAIKELNKAKTEKDIKEKVLPHLPPLTRKRVEALLKKKKMNKIMLLRLLIAESFFLTKLKFMLLSITPKQLKSVLSSILRAMKK